MEYEIKYLKDMEETYLKSTFLEKDYLDEFKNSLDSLLPTAPY